MSRRPIATSLWMAAGFLVALALAAVVLALFGAGYRGTGLALRVTARWSFTLVLARLCRQRDRNAGRAPFSRVGAQWTRPGPLLRLGAARPCRAHRLALFHRVSTERWDGFLLGRDTLHLSTGALLLTAAEQSTRAAPLARHSARLRLNTLPSFLPSILFSLPVGRAWVQRISAFLPAVCPHACWWSGSALRRVRAKPVTAARHI